MFGNEDPFENLPSKSDAPRTEVQKRDQALALVEGANSALVEEARRVAMLIWKENGRVTSTEVLARMSLDPRYAETIAEGKKATHKNRWMGPVFKAKQGWVKLGYESKGSHARPVVIWTR